mmetsp:Transcript_41181/g.39682  ORF Transcript_41181/g.39682 Transcript_41181/m.39682 type:complete len:101 (+) Transcript_41181:1057-1359(+)
MGSQPIHPYHPNMYQRSVSPMMHRGIPEQHNSEELVHIKTTTQNLTKDMKIMKKLIEDLHMSISEKDAEIIKLNMHLGDEKKRFQTFIRKPSHRSLHHNN